jgi:hypothetical protein
MAALAQLQQWTFEKPAQRASTASSASSSPVLGDDTPTLRLDTAAAAAAADRPAPRKESIALQERYMSSEEALSPVEDASDDEYDYDYENVVVHDAANHPKARAMSVSRWDKGKSCDMAVMVSYAFVGRPKVVELDCRSPTTEIRPGVQQRSASLANLPFAISQLKADAAHRLSMKPMPNRLSVVPPVELEARRPSTSYSPVTKPLSDSDASDRAAPSTRSISPAVDELLARPALAPINLSSARSSVYLPSHSRSNLSRIHTTQSLWAAPLTPASPAPHAFLSSDPYEASSASPIIKPAPHKRLRSISMKLALAKIAISPKKADHPRIPSSPLTPQTAPLESSSYFSPQKLRRASTILRPKSRHGDSIRGPSPDPTPPMPAISASMQKRMSKMQARGANEREPTLVIPPCPTDDDASFKSRTLRKRKSLMSLMDAL